MFHPAANRQSLHFLELPWKTDELLPPLMLPNTKGRDMLHEFEAHTDN